MLDDSHASKIATLEQRISLLTSKLAEAKAAVQQWTDANAALSRSAAEARAENQGAGRGFLGGLLGSKFRGAMRTGAAASNAAIAKQVVEKRAHIADGKRESQNVVRNIQESLKSAKLELKTLTSKTKAKAQTKVAITKAVNDSLQLLQKLKEARDAGLLTEVEYEEKRKKLVSEI